MKPFAQTSYLSQVKRLRQLAELALARYQVRVKKLTFINHGENTTFRVDAIGGKKFLLRIHRDGYHSPAALQEEVDWLHRLAKVKEVQVPVPVRSKKGDFLEHVVSPAVENGRYCDLLKWVEGAFIFKSAKPKHLYQLGQLMARLHRSTRGRKVKHRIYWDANGLVGPAPKFGAFDKIKGLAPAKQRFLNQKRAELFRTLRKFERSFPERQGLIHADLHFGNFVVAENGLGAIDFDDCGFGFHAYDLVIPLTHIAHLCKKRKIPLKPYVDAIQEGYASLGRWDQHDTAILPYLLAARRLVMVGWLNSRSDNPKLKAWVLKNANHAVKEFKGNWRELA